MATLSSVPSQPRGAETKYGIGLTSFSQFISGFAFDGSPKMDDEQMPLRVGDFHATQEGRKRYGPVMLRYIADRAIESAGIEEAGTINMHAKIAEGALQKLLLQRDPAEDDVKGLTMQGRSAKERDVRRQFGEEARRLRTEAVARRVSEPVIDAALVASQTFKDDDLRVLAEDSALALASVEAPQALPEPLDRIYPQDGISPSTGLHA